MPASLVEVAPSITKVFHPHKKVSTRFITAVFLPASLARVLDLCRGDSDQCHEVLAKLFQATQRQTTRAWIADHCRSSAFRTIR